MASAELTRLELLEREEELAELRGLLVGARAGRGGVAFVEGRAGQGKTALLRALRGEAGSEGFRVLSASAAELERDFAFGLVRQLLEPALRSGAEALLVGAASLAAPIFAMGGESTDAVTDATHARLHGLFWLVANLAEEQPLLVLVDDAHWGDAPSLRYLDVLARRIEDLPIVLAVSARPAEPGAEQDLLDALAAASATRVVEPRPLSRGAIAHLVERAIGRVGEPAFVDACVETTGGNALLVRELVRELAQADFTGVAAEADAVRHAVPGTVTRTVLARLRRLSPEALALARSVAVLGDRSTIARVGALAGCGQEAAVTGTTALIRVGLVEPATLQFVHPLVREAVLSDLVAGERASWHRSAARLLQRDGAPDAEVATHLIATDPEGDAASALALLGAGRRALSDGAADVAVRLLRRALAEPPSGDDRPAVLLALGEAEAKVAAPEAAAHLEEAVSGPDARVAAQAARVGAPLLSLCGRSAEAAVLLGRARDRVEGFHPDLYAELGDVRLQILPYHEPLIGEYARLLENPGPEPRPAMLSHLAQRRALQGAPAEEVLDLARRALRSGALVRETGVDRLSYAHAFSALLLVEAADELAVAIQDATELARRTGSRITIGTLEYTRALWEQAFGEIRRGVDHARRALELITDAGAMAAVVPARVVLVAVLIDQGDLAEAERVIADHPSTDRVGGFHGMHGVRARLLLLRGRPEEALAELEALFAIEHRRGWKISNRTYTRDTQVRALVAAGRLEEARETAEAALAMAQRRGVHGSEAVARLARASLLGASERPQELMAAVDVARRSPCRLVLAQALAELGGELRRAGRRVESREPLREARDLARRCGARALEERAHEELVIAGARPHRVALAGVDALTAAERRVAELAAEGLRNRDIAETLFVTLKTVEVHLGRAYGKLGIQGRSQLAAALRADG